jgi:hypothetical protein
MVNGNIMHRKDGFRGRFLTGKQFGDFRRKTWPLKMQAENIEVLEIYWYVSHGGPDSDNPREIEIKLLCKFLSEYGELPKWNNEI